jgi:linoleate 10R-lipoxygenase
MGRTLRLALPMLPNSFDSPIAPSRALPMVSRMLRLLQRARTDSTHPRSPPVLSTASRHRSVIPLSPSSNQSSLRLHHHSLQLRRGAPLTLDTIPGVLDALAHANSTGLNDRLFLFEDVIGLMSRLPPGDVQQKLEDFTIGLLYHDLPHPPINFLPASIPLADFQAAQDPEATRRVKTGLGTAYKPDSPAAAGAGADPAADPGAGAGACAGAGPNEIIDSSSSSPPSPENPRAQTTIAGLPTPPSSRFSPTTTTVDESPSSSLTASIMRTSLDSDPSWQKPNPKSSLENKKYSTQFRTPTGAGNNPHMPLLGASNTPYARSVPSLRPIPPSTLPDAGLVFDTLLRRTPPPPGDPTVKGQGHGQRTPVGLAPSCLRLLRSSFIPCSAPAPVPIRISI